MIESETRSVNRYPENPGVLMSVIANSVDNFNRQGFDPEMSLRLALVKFVMEYYAFAFPAINSGYRSPQRQLELYNAYLDGTQTQKPARQSWHTVGRAVDMNVPTAILPLVVAIWKYLGGRWGGEFSDPDPVHFDLPGKIPPPSIY